MKRIVRMKFFQDDATGEWGLAHKETYNDNNAFNAGWGALMIFHDVFEHWHEYNHKYFQGKNAMNVGGEMAAMGAMWYFYNEMGISERMNGFGGYYSPCERMRQTTESEIEEAIKSGYTRYGDTLECGVPYQRPVEDGELDYQCRKLAENAHRWGFRSNSQYDTEDERNISKTYKKSVTLSKIQRLHRWGYHNAERFIPNNAENRATLREFWEYWGRFTKELDAEEMARLFDHIEFTVTKRKGLVSWTAKLIGQYEIPDYKISSKNLRYIPSEEDFWPIEQETY